MLKTSSRAPAIALGLALIFIAHAKADILDDILGATTAARDRATQARDRATEARDRATAARDSANEIRDHVREGVAALTDEVQTLISEAVEDLQQIAADELEGRDAFLTDGGCSMAVCEPFRENLVSLLRNIEALVNTVLSILEMEDLQFDFEREITVINLLPGRALFPLFRVLAVESNLLGSDTRGSGFLGQLSDAVAKLMVLKEALEDKICGEDPKGEPKTLLESEVRKCRCVMDNAANVEVAAKRVKLTGLALKLVGKGLSAKGETTAGGINPGIHGYINLTIKDNKKKAWGERLDGLSDILSKIAEAADDKLRDCLNFSTQAEILAGLGEIKAALDGDLDRDGDIDLGDYSLFQRAFGSRR